ncbi:RecE exonuclease VIII [Iodobacter phage PhiPLPE]|uniref:RecE exonuclease VIII n=1 Tax=Iodobacter phage PhiPLPE TaxID=551895 RepID=B5AX98_9CAUD|nr:exonuclease VIII [Iodobacter phage PhiPLPE]ACG60401.1 RecE exonuclease VIII [Iodobacter phage PhiPLPE]
MTNDEYHAAEGVSKSKLDVFAQSPRHYWLKYLNPNKKEEEEKEHYIIGRASHSAVLEPDDFASRYVCVPSDAPKKPTKAQLDAPKPSDSAAYLIAWWDEFNEANKDKVILSAEQYQDCLDLRDCVWSDKTAAGLLRDGMAEQSHFATDPETGLMLKCRPDYQANNGIITDLKFVRDASYNGFGRACANHRYDVQAAFYQDVLSMAEGGKDRMFAFIAVEKYEHGPVAGVYWSDDEMVISGRNKWRREVNSLAQCQASNNWPGYTVDGLPVNFPKYAKDL